ELGWHPCLTLDRPISPLDQVGSLIRPDGSFWPLNALVFRLAAGRIRSAEIETELRAQYGRFCDLAGHPPTVVNSHHHVQVFPLIGSCLRRILAEQKPPPYVRRIRESWQTLVSVRGARPKRLFLTLLGRSDARQQDRQPFPGNESLA